MYTTRIIIALTSLIAMASLGGSIACSPMTTKMNPKAAGLKVVGDNAVSDCAFKGMVTSRQGTNFVSYEGNVENATNDLMNKAAAKGATHIVLGSPSKQDMGSLGNDGCNNCVVMSAKAYRCAAKSKK